MKKLIYVIAVLIAATACNIQKKVEPAAIAPLVLKDTVTHKFTAKDVVNTKDYICGMPVTAGIEDTVHYKGKVYGFCSAGCKEDFAKSPKTYLTAKK
jgi:YHS domain-containing protein